MTYSTALICTNFINVDFVYWFIDQLNFFHELNVHGLCPFFFYDISLISTNLGSYIYIKLSVVKYNLIFSTVLSLVLSFSYYLYMHIQIDDR